MYLWKYTATEYIYIYIYFGMLNNKLTWEPWNRDTKCAGASVENWYKQY